MHLGSRGQRLEQPPLRSRQVLEAIGEDRARPPCVDIAGQAVDGSPPDHAPVPGVEPVELGAIGPRKGGERVREVVRLEQRAVQLRQRSADRVREAGGSRTARAGGARDPADQHRALRLAQKALAAATAASERVEQRVERPDRSREEAAYAFEELALDMFDVRALRDDQPRVAVERGEEPLEKLPDLAGVCRPDDERETHRAMVVGRLQRPVLRQEVRLRRVYRRRERPSYASDLGLRPRRATADPGMPPAHESHRSAAFAPRRASLKVTRITAPFPSSTSAPHLSQTRTVFRATIPPRSAYHARDFWSNRLQRVPNEYTRIFLCLDRSDATHIAR